MALNVIGEVMDTDYFIRTMSERRGIQYGLRKLSDKDGVTEGYVNNDMIDRRISLLNDLGFDVNYDPEIIQFMSAIVHAKDIAIKGINYILTVYCFVLQI